MGHYDDYYEEDYKKYAKQQAEYRLKNLNILNDALNKFDGMGMNSDLCDLIKKKANKLKILVDAALREEQADK